LGFGLLQWSHSALGKNWSDQPRILAGQKLISEGPYRWVRHPIYTAFLMILGSTLLITANWFIGGMWILNTGIDIRARIQFEEARLLVHFGQAYREYSARTGALLPRIFGAYNEESI
jgi:protein-S-isoprenylcysteine O-methyltransferase Ste14